MSKDENQTLSLTRDDIAREIARMLGDGELDDLLVNGDRDRVEIRVRAILAISKRAREEYTNMVSRATERQSGETRK